MARRGSEGAGEGFEHFQVSLVSFIVLADADARDVS